MKFIDEKGMLFGKINIIDFLVIFLIFCLLPLGYFSYNIILKKRAIPENSRVYTELVLACRAVELAPDTVKLIKEKDTEKDSQSAEIIGEILYVGEAKPYVYTLNIGSPNRVSKEDAYLKEINLRVKLKIERRNGDLYYKNKQIALGSPFDFRAAGYAIKIIPMEIERKDNKRINLNVAMKGLTDDTAKLIAVGDKEIDEKGETVAEILSIGKTDNDTFDIDMGAGNVISGEDSQHKQTYVKMSIKCGIDDSSQLYIKGEKIGYNTYFKFKTAKYSVNCKLMSMLLNEKWVVVKVKFGGVIPELAKALNEGDIEKDPAGRIIGRLKTIESNKPSETQVLALEQNKFLTVPQPFYRDITVSLNLLCIEKDGVLYFKNYPVKMGNMISFATNLYSISGVVVNLEY